MEAQLLTIESEGDSVDEAVATGLAALGCTRAEVEIEILQVPARKLFGLLGTQPARVRLTLIDRGFIAGRYTEHLLTQAGFDARVEVGFGREQIDLMIESAESSLIIGRRGATLEALQSLVVTLTDRRVKDRTPIVLDIDGYRRRKRASLRRLANRLCRQVRRTGRKATVNPLPPDERRLFHLALKDEFGVECRSVGQGHERKMILTPRKSSS